MKDRRASSLWIMTSTFQGFTLFSHQFEAYYGKRYFVYRIPWKSALKSSDVRDNVKHEHNSRIVTMSRPLFSCRLHRIESNISLRISRTTHQKC